MADSINNPMEGTEKPLNNPTESLQLELDLKKFNNDLDKVKIEKVNTLKGLLESVTFDSGRTILGSEPVFRNVFTEGEEYTIKNKIFEILKKF